MTRRRLALAVLLVVATSCTRDIRRAGPRSPVPSPRATGAATTSSTAPGTSAAPGSTSAAGGARTAAPTAGTTSQTSPPGTQPDGARIPKPGTYVYAVSSPQGGGQETSVEIGPGRTVPGGTELSVRIGSQVTTQRWERTRVLLLRLQLSTSEGDVECRFNTSAGGLELAHFPYRPETFPRQEWSNDRCSGFHQQQVVGQENLTVRGRTWSTWKVVTTTRLRIDLPTEGGTPEPGDFTTRQTQWVAPDLGVDVKTESTSQSDGSSDTSTRELTAYPS